MFQASFALQINHACLLSDFFYLFKFLVLLFFGNAVSFHLSRLLLVVGRSASKIIFRQVNRVMLLIYESKVLVTLKQHQKFFLVFLYHIIF